ncbi:hypothetical protein IC582_013090 [Cucumis melo]
MELWMLTTGHRVRRRIFIWNLRDQRKRMKLFSHLSLPDEDWIFFESCIDLGGKIQMHQRQFLSG